MMRLKVPQVTLAVTSETQIETRGTTEVPHAAGNCRKSRKRPNVVRIKVDDLGRSGTSSTYAGELQTVRYVDSVLSECFPSYISTGM